MIAHNSTCQRRGLLCFYWNNLALIEVCKWHICSRWESCCVTLWSLNVTGHCVHRSKEEIGGRRAGGEELCFSSTPVFTFKKFTGKKKKKSVIYILQWSLMKEMINNPPYVPDMSQKPAANASVTIHTRTEHISLFLLVSPLVSLYKTEFSRGIKGQKVTEEEHQSRYNKLHSTQLEAESPSWVSSDMIIFPQLRCVYCAWSR